MFMQKGKLKTTIEQDTREAAIKEKQKLVADLFKKEAPLEDKLSKIAFATHFGTITHPNAEKAVTMYKPVGEHPERLYADVSSIHSRYIDCSIQEGGAAASRPANILLTRLDEDPANSDPGPTLYEHLQKDDEDAKRVFTVEGQSYEETRGAFLHVRKAGTPSCTDHLIRQIFFPVGNENYHLLSILPSTTFLYEMKHRYALWNANRKREKGAEEAHDKLPPFVRNSYGGDGMKPLNISTLAMHLSKAQNSIKDGSNIYLAPRGAILFASIPPSFRRDAKKLPKKDFFEYCYYNLRLSSSYKAMLRFFEKPYLLLNYKEQNALEKLQSEVLDRMLGEIYRLRELDSGWSDELSIQIPVSQRHLLDCAYTDTLTEEDIQEIAELAVQKTKTFLKKQLPLKGKTRFTCDDAYMSVLSNEWHRILKLLFLP